MDLSEFKQIVELAGLGEVKHYDRLSIYIARSPCGIEYCEYNYVSQEWLYGSRGVEGYGKTFGESSEQCYQNQEKG
jgi:hypothetical protein